MFLSLTSSVASCWNLGEQHAPLMIKHSLVVIEACLTMRTLTSEGKFTHVPQNCRVQGVVQLARYIEERCREKDSTVVVRRGYLDI